MKTTPNKTEITKQIKNAFEFIQKLYNESSYLIKEIEGQLGENEYRFQILKTSGYSISARSSTGLEPNNVNLWLLRKFGVAFVGESNTELKKVIVAYGDEVVMRDNLQDALEAVFGSLEKISSEEVTPSLISTESTVSQSSKSEVYNAMEHFQKAREAMQKGDWATMGKELDEVEKGLRKIMELE